MLNFFPIRTDFDFWEIIDILGVIFFLTVALIIAIRLHKDNSQTLKKSEKKSLSQDQAKVLALLRRHGGRMSQVQIAAHFNGDIGLVVDILMELEQKVKIKRYWDWEKAVYLISAAN